MRWMRLKKYYIPDLIQVPKLRKKNFASIGGQFVSLYIFPVKINAVLIFSWRIPERISISHYRKKEIVEVKGSRQYQD